MLPGSESMEAAVFTLQHGSPGHLLDLSQEHSLTTTCGAPGKLVLVVLLLSVP